MSDEIDPKSFASLTPERRKAVLSAQCDSAAPETHRRQAHSVFSLKFLRLLLDSLVNRGRTDPSKPKAIVRLNRSKALRYFLICVGLLAATVVLCYLLYLFKSALGIDVFKDRHLSDILGLRSTIGAPITFDTGAPMMKTHSLEIALRR